MRLPGTPAILILSAMGFAALLGGCSDNTSAPSPIDSGSQTIDLDDPNGGFLPTDEDPAFGDPELAGTASHEDPVTDGCDGLSVRQRAQISAMESHPRSAWYSFTALWGYLEDTDNDSAPGDLPESQDPVAWDGRLVLSRGGIKLLNLILFEPDQGDRVLPRAEPGRLEWESTTWGSADGVRVLLIVPPDTSGTADPVTLTFQAGAYSREFSIGDLDSLNELIEVSATEAVSLRAFRADPAAELRGLCHGVWGRAQGDSVGTFKGRWIARRGELLGWMRGHYGENSDGEQVFFGKYVDTAGRFRGILRGHYRGAEDGEPGTPRHHQWGRFHGEWIGERGMALGKLDGHWSQRGAQGRGHFEGVWQGRVLAP